jgi:hypothetical protein
LISEDMIDTVLEVRYLSCQCALFHP